MDYAKPLHSREKVNAAGRRLIEYINSEEGDDALLDQAASAILVIENFRAAHNFPLNSFHITLKRRAEGLAGGAITAQRTKRMRSIINKLADQSEMKLSQMQDIAGCRAIMPGIEDVWFLREMYDKKPVKHVRGSDKDYITNPKETGYRGLHLKYRFSGKGNSEPWNELKVEIQLRTMLQHKWATAVEAAQTFTNDALKSNKGSKEWLRFFALMSSVFALKEGCPTIPGTPDRYGDLQREIIALNDQYHFQAMFSQYGHIIPHLEKKLSHAKYLLVTLDPLKHDVTIQGFKSHQTKDAHRAYTEAEDVLGKDKAVQVVLVSVQSIKALKLAYPNYFLDTQDFLREVAAVTGQPIVLGVGRPVASTALQAILPLEVASA